MTDIFALNQQLFSDISFHQVTKHSSFTHHQSIFKDEWYNFIIPHKKSELLEWQKVSDLIQAEHKRQYSLSLYIKEDIRNNYESFFAKHNHNQEIGSEVYKFNHITTPSPAQGELVTIDQHKLAEYLKFGQLCFPEWENSQEYGNYCYRLQLEPPEGYVVKNYLFNVDDHVVGFAGLIISLKLGLSYMHNVGIHPDFRRRGLFLALTKQLQNISLSYGVKTIYALVEKDGASYHGYTKLGYKDFATYYLYNT